MTFKHIQLEQLKGGRLFALLLTIVIVQTAGFYSAAVFVNGPGSLATPQPDTLLYCQAARRICEGCAFSFSAGTQVSTGTTSVLYPFVLAVPHLLGCVGQGLIRAGFILNALFYAVFVLGWAGAFLKWLPRRTALFAAFSLALFPQPAFCALAQSDTGLWMATSAILAYALSSNRAVLTLVMLCLAPWVRPEGMMVAFVCGLIGLWTRDRRQVALACIAGLSILGVFLLNFYLTGKFGFSSTAGKGCFTTMGLCAAIRESFAEFIILIRDLFLGQSSKMPRTFYALPFIGAAAACIGVATADKRILSRSFLVCLGAAVLAMFSVAQSGWQGSNTDRYAAWMMPMFILFASVGWCWLADRAKGKMQTIIFSLPLVYYVFSIPVFIATYKLSCESTERMVRYASEINRIIPANASIGTMGYSGIAYCLGDRRVANLSGIYSPEFQAHDYVGLLEILKREPPTRFDYWIIHPDDGAPKSVLAKLGDSILTGPDMACLKQVNWRIFDAAESAVCSNMTLRCRVDVGYGKDERASDYEIVTSYGMLPFEPIVSIAKLKGQWAIDGGRIVVGYDEMNVTNLTPGKDVVVFLRTTDKVTATGNDGLGKGFSTEYSFHGENEMHIEIDGRLATCAHAHIENSDFSDVRFLIPGRAITKATHRIRFHGDHVAFGYWFYQ